MITSLLSSPAFIWIAMIVIMLLSMLISNRLQSRFAKYKEVPLNISGAEVAQRMLASHGIRDVQITCIEGTLTDHYNPQTKTVNLSKDVYYGKHVAAAAVAAHECGHVVQHQVGYLPLRMRSALVPVVSFANNIVSWVLLAGVLLVEAFPQLLWAGIILFALTTLFSFVTLPVEINASARAVGWLEDAGIVSYETKDMAVDALKWAAYTYVIAAIGSLANLLYYITIARNRR
jgi:Zn-dependent membrane protease YugP